MLEDTATVLAANARVEEEDEEEEVEAQAGAGGAVGTGGVISTASTCFPMHVCKRFSDFVALQGRLRQDGCEEGLLPPLPPKASLQHSLLGVGRARRVAARRQGLQRWLTAVT
eukprot:COSAG01_NODE_20984_length_923_cov_19.474515_1_plen_113_part_00